MENKNVTTVTTVDVKTDDELSTATTVEVDEYKMDKRSSLVIPGNVEKEKRWDCEVIRQFWEIRFGDFLDKVAGEEFIFIQK